MTNYVDSIKYHNGLILQDGKSTQEAHVESNGDTSWAQNSYEDGFDAAFYGNGFGEGYEDFDFGELHTY